MLTPMLGEQIELVLCCQPGLPPVAGDASMTEQVVMNLTVNARDAMPNGGTLHIETFAVEIPAALACQNPAAHAGSFICLCVRDTGCGIERKVLQRIFEPFFTTKEIGKGTGLGLSTVYSIVQQHQGWVEVESEVGVGTTFKVFLPVADVKAGAFSNTGGGKSEKVNGGKETILVVEDETSVLKVLCTVLESYHYHVLSAVSAAEAMRVWNAQCGKIDLLLTDMIMPGGMTGRDLVTELKKHKPGLKAIITSGYSAELAGRDFNNSDTRFLAKPYQSHTVAQLVRNTLDTPNRRHSNGVAAGASLNRQTHIASASAA
jgi:CheY-like chemotaxis protein